MRKRVQRYSRKSPQRSRGKSSLLSDSMAAGSNEGLGGTSPASPGRLMIESPTAVSELRVSSQWSDVLGRGGGGGGGGGGASRGQGLEGQEGGKIRNHRLVRAECAIDMHASFDPATESPDHLSPMRSTMPSQHPGDLATSSAAEMSILKAHEAALFEEVKSLRKYPSMVSTLSKKEMELRRVICQQDVLSAEMRGENLEFNAELSRRAVDALQLSQRMPWLGNAKQVTTVAEAVRKESFIKELVEDAALGRSASLFPTSGLAPERQRNDGNETIRKDKDKDKDVANKSAGVNDRGEMNKHVCPVRDGAQEQESGMRGMSSEEREKGEDNRGGEEAWDELVCNVFEPKGSFGHMRARRTLVVQQKANRDVFEAKISECSMVAWELEMEALGDTISGYPRFHHQVLPMLVMSKDLNRVEGNRQMFRIPATMVCKGSICTGFYASAEASQGINSIDEFEDVHVSQVAPEMLQLAQNHHQASTLPAFLAKSFNRKPTSIELKRMRERQRAGVAPAKDSYPDLDSRPYTIAGYLPESTPEMLPFSVTSHTWTCEAPATVFEVQDLLHALEKAPEHQTTILQRFVPSPSGKAEVLRIAYREGDTWGEGDERYGMWLMRSRKGYFDPSCNDWAAGHRVMINTEEVEAYKYSEVYGITSKSPRAGPEDVRWTKGWHTQGVGYGFVTRSGLVNKERIDAACEILDSLFRVVQTKMKEAVELVAKPGLMDSMKSMPTFKHLNSRALQARPKPSRNQSVILEGVCADFIVDDVGRVLLLKVRDCKWGLAEKANRM